jgi:hypothetical protein
LALAGLIISADAAVDGNLPHLNPLRSGLIEAPHLLAFSIAKHVPDCFSRYQAWFWRQEADRVCCQFVGHGE